MRNFFQGSLSFKGKCSAFFFFIFSVFSRIPFSPFGNVDTINVVTSFWFY